MLHINDKAPDFSLVLGGPLYQLLRRASLSDDALLLMKRRIILFALVCWLPLLVFASMQGNLLGGSVEVPFLLDAEVHIRFLVVVPLLIIAELVVHQRMRPLLALFLERQLIPQQDMSRFNAAVASAFRLRNSITAEVILVAFVYTVGVLIIWRNFTSVATTTWYATPTEGGRHVSLAGLWLGWVSVPIFQFLLVRWYFRIFIWARFLWQVSRIDLALMPTHPDRAGGLGFLTNTTYAFLPLLTAHGAMLAGLIAQRVFHLDAKLTDFKIEIGVMVVFLLCLVQGPLLVFTSQLARMKRVGAREYGTLAEVYVREFDTKWLRGGAPADGPLIGSADIQSLADLGNSFEVVRTIRMFLVSREAIVLFTGAIVAPIVPLVLTVMPLEELLKTLAGVLF